MFLPKKIFFYSKLAKKINIPFNQNKKKNNKINFLIKNLILSNKIYFFLILSLKTKKLKNNLKNNLQIFNYFKSKKITKNSPNCLLFNKYLLIINKKKLKNKKIKKKNKFVPNMFIIKFRKEIVDKKFYKQKKKLLVLKNKLLLIEYQKYLKQFKFKYNNKLYNKYKINKNKIKNQKKKKFFFFFFEHLPYTIFANLFFKFKNIVNLCVFRKKIKKEFKFFFNKMINSKKKVFKKKYLKNYLFNYNLYIFLLIYSNSFFSKNTGLVLFKNLKKFFISNKYIFIKKSYKLNLKKKDFFKFEKKLWLFFILNIYFNLFKKRIFNFFFKKTTKYIKNILNNLISNLLEKNKKNNKLQMLINFFYYSQFINISNNQSNIIIKLIIQYFLFLNLKIKNNISKFLFYILKKIKKIRKKNIKILKKKNVKKLSYAYLKKIYKKKKNCKIFKYTFIKKGFNKYFFRGAWKLKTNLKKKYIKKKKNNKYIYNIKWILRKKPYNKNDYVFVYKFKKLQLFLFNKIQTGFKFNIYKIFFNFNKRKIKYYSYWYSKHITGDLEINYRIHFLKKLPFNCCWTWSGLEIKKIPSFIYYIQTNYR